MRFLQCLSVSASLVLATLLSGCADPGTTKGTSGSSVVEVHGYVHGGQQPVSGATIQLYAVGITGYQSASTTKLTSTVTTKADGSFSITGAYTCGSATQVYITATGGSAVAARTNSNLAMMTALGACSSLGASTYISINEVTTAAAVSALAPYMASPTSIGTSTGGTYSTDEALALAQAFTLAGEFASSTTGQAPGVNIPSGMTNPTSLVNTLGNILAACINSTGGVAGDSTACGKLFSLAKNSSGTAPTDTLTAMLNIANHPTVNVSSLYNLSTSTAPFQPALTSAPTTYDVALIPATTSVTRTLYIEPDNGFTFLYNLVNAATKTIDMTMYELVDTTMSADLVNACKRGVVVRVILDQNNEKSNNASAYSQLNAQTNCSAAYANPAFQVTHQKSLIIDSTTAVIMSANLTSRYYTTTRDFALVENDPVDIAAMQATFNTDYGSTTDYSYVPTNGNDLIWSPTTARGSLVTIINNATSTLMVENEEMSDPTVVAALEAACKRGVVTHIAMTDTGSYHSNYTALEAAGCGVHTYADSSNILYIHAKVIVADYGTSAQLGYMGSINFSTASLIENRELGVYISDATILGTLNSTLVSDYAGASAY